MNADVRTPESISWPQRRGSIGEERLGERMERVVRRKVRGDMVVCLVVGVRTEDLKVLLFKGG